MIEQNSNFKVEPEKIRQSMESPARVTIVPSSIQFATQLTAPYLQGNPQYAGKVLRNI